MWLQLPLAPVSAQAQISISQEHVLLLNLVDKNKCFIHWQYILGGGGWSDSGPADPSKLYEYVGYDAESGRHVCLKCSNFSHKSRSNARNHVEAVHFPALFTYSCQVCGQETGSKNALNIHMTRFHKTRNVAGPPQWMTLSQVIWRLWWQRLRAGRCVSFVTKSWLTNMMLSDI